MLNGIRIEIACEHDNGEPIRKHKKKRIKKKWLKRYGVYCTPFDADHILYIQDTNTIYMSGSTYRRVKAQLNMGVD